MDGWNDVPIAIIAIHVIMEKKELNIIDLFGWVQEQ